MNKTIFATLALIGLCGLAACNDAETGVSYEEEAAARHAAVLDAEATAVQEATVPVETAADQATEALEAPPAPVPEVQFEDHPGSTLRYRNVGSVGYCDVYEVQVADRSYILTQNTYSSTGSKACQITPR